MSLFDFFRGILRGFEGRYRGDVRRDPLFDRMTHDDDADEDDDGHTYDNGCDRVQQDPFDEAWRFGFSFSPSGLEVHEPRVFRHILRDMEELFSGLRHWQTMRQLESFSEFHTVLEQTRTVYFNIRSIDFPPPQASPEQGERRASGNSLRDFMLKSPDSSLPPPSSPSATPGAPRDGGIPSSRSPTSPFHHWSAFIKISEMWREGFRKREEEETEGEDGDVDSQFPLEGEDQTQPLSKSQPKTQSVFTSVTVTKVVRPDGTVEERRTVRDSQGNEETTVTISGGPGDSRQPQKQLGPGAPGVSPHSSAEQDDLSMFSGIFRGFRR